MDFIFIKSLKAGKEDFGSVYARVRTGKANVKTVTGFTIRQLEWEKYRSLQYTSSALMSSIGIKYGQFAQVLARIKAAFEAEDFDPKKAKSVIESVKHDVLNGMMQIVEVKPKGRMLFEDFLNSYIEDLETGRRTKKGRTVKVTPAYIKGLRIILNQIRNYQKETHRKIGLDDMTMETRNSLVGYWKERGLMPNAINSYMTDVRTVAKAAFEDKLTKCDGFRHSDFVPKKEEVDNIYLTPEQIQEMLELDLSTKEAVRERLEELKIDEEEKVLQLSKCRITHIRTLEHVRDVFIVGCLTGQRVSDYSRICEDMITEINGTEFILLTQQKTDKKVYIPVDRRVRQILDKYDGRLPHVCPNEMNKLIKTVGLLLGWTHDCGFDGKRLNPKRGRRFCDMLLSHTARRSFATNAYKAGVPLSSIQAITGHSSEAQLRRYLKLDAEERAVIALKDFEGIIEM
ncbi:site-specific integrase [Bacteroides ovatus]|uniref:site-specific integrase n=1 Tax=Bacteroides ovatus TaxID=28116 RepID=UPI0032199481